MFYSIKKPSRETRRLVLSLKREYLLTLKREYLLTSLRPRSKNKNYYCYAPHNSRAKRAERAHSPIAQKILFFCFWPRV